MRKPLFLGAFCTVAALCMAPMCRADLTGTKVTGDLVLGGVAADFYDPGTGDVPAGFQNSAGAQNSTTITILGGGNDFGFSDGFNQDVTSFSGTGFTFTDTCLGGNVGCGTSPSIRLFFTDTAFTGVTLNSSTFGGLTFGIFGDEIAISIPSAPTGFPGGAASYTASFDVTTVPEPASLTLLGSGLIGLAGAFRRRKRA